MRTSTQILFINMLRVRKWEVKCNRLIMSCYGEGGAIDIRLMNTDKDLQHQINITIEDGKLKAIVSEQTK